MRMSNSLLFLPEVNAYKIQSPYILLNGGRFNSRVWSESDKIWCGQLRICLGKSCREVRLEEPYSSGELFVHTLIPLHSVDYSVLDSHERFVMDFTDGGIQSMHLGLEFRESSDACKFYRALICSEEGEGEGEGEEEEGEGEESEDAESGSNSCYEVHVDVDVSEKAGKTRKDPRVVHLSQKAIKILKEIIEAGHREDLKVLELEAENLRVNCELTELQKVNARHIEWLKEKNDQVKELEAKQKHVELEKLDLQQQISTLIEESAAKTNQISMLIEESAAKTNQMKELEKMFRFNNLNVDRNSGKRKGASDKD